MKINFKSMAAMAAAVSMLASMSGCGNTTVEVPPPVSNSAETEESIPETVSEESVTEFQDTELFEEETEQPTEEETEPPKEEEPSDYDIMLYDYYELVRGEHESGNAHCKKTFYSKVDPVYDNGKVMFTNGNISDTKVYFYDVESAQLTEVALDHAEDYSPNSVYYYDGSFYCYNGTDKTLKKISPDGNIEELLNNVPGVQAFVNDKYIITSSATEGRKIVSLENPERAISVPDAHIDNPDSLADDVYEYDGFIGSYGNNLLARIRLKSEMYYLDMDSENPEWINSGIIVNDDYYDMAEFHFIGNYLSVELSKFASSAGIKLYNLETMEETDVKASPALLDKGTYLGNCIVYEKNNDGIYYKLYFNEGSKKAHDETVSETPVVREFINNENQLPIVPVSDERYVYANDEGVFIRNFADENEDTILEFDAE